LKVNECGIIVMADGGHGPGGRFGCPRRCRRDGQAGRLHHKRGGEPNKGIEFLILDRPS
jgi:hypothetical protein